MADLVVAIAQVAAGFAMSKDPLKAQSLLLLGRTKSWFGVASGHRRSCCCALADSARWIAAWSLGGDERGV